MIYCSNALQDLNFYLYICAYVYVYMFIYLHMHTFFNLNRYGKIAECISCSELSWTCSSLASLRYFFSSFSTGLLTSKPNYFSFNVNTLNHFAFDQFCKRTCLTYRSKLYCSMKHRSPISSNIYYLNANIPSGSLSKTSYSMKSTFIFREWSEKRWSYFLL